MAKNPHLIEESKFQEALGTNWIPVENVPPIIPGRAVAAPPVSDLSPRVPQYNQGSLPSNFMHDADFVNTAQRATRAPSHDLMPLPLSGNSISSA